MRLAVLSLFLTMAASSLAAAEDYARRARPQSADKRKLHTPGLAAVCLRRTLAPVGRSKASASRFT